MFAHMYLGIEIGGSKLQLGVGDGGGGELTAVVRLDVNARRGAAGILGIVGIVGGGAL